MTPALRRLLALVVAVILALVGVLAVLDYARRADERAIADQRPVEVLLVTREIPRGTPSEEVAGSVRSVLLPAAAVAQGAVDDLAELSGLVAAVDLVPGEQLIAARFVTEDELDAPEPTLVPPGLQEISFLLSMERVVGGRIAPGDLVAVLATFDDVPRTGDIIGASDDPLTVTALLVDRLLVTFVQYSDAQALPTESGQPLVPSGELLITFAVDTATAERLTFAFDQGRVRLTLLNPDTEQSDRTLTSRENIFG